MKILRAFLCVAFLAACSIAAQAAPNPTAINPVSGSTSGNEFVTITGTGFVATPTVTIRTRRNGPERIPHKRLGKYLKFDPGSTAFQEWLRRHDVDSEASNG